MWLIEQLYIELKLGQRTAISWLVTTIMQYAAKSFISIDYGNKKIEWNGIKNILIGHNKHFYK